MRRAPRPGERGDSTLLFALVLVACVGLGIAYFLTMGRNQLKNATVRQSSETAWQGSISNVAQLKALLHFPAILPATATNTSYLPAVYPDPYVDPNNPKHLVATGLLTFHSAGSLASYAADGSGGIYLNSYDSRNLTQGTVDNLFSLGLGAGLPALSGSRLLQSHVAFKAVVPDPAWPGALQQVTVASSAAAVEKTSSSVKATGRSNFTAAIDLPLPPQPDCAFDFTDPNGKVSTVPNGGVAPGGPYAVTAPFQLQLRGYGITTSATFFGPLTPLPAAAGTITNAMAGGFLMGKPLAFSATNTRYGMPAGVSWSSSGNPSLYGYMVFTGQIAGPGNAASLRVPPPVGPSNACDVLVPVYVPPTCFITPNGYDFNGAASCVTITLNPVGATSFERIFDPNASWVNGVSGPLSYNFCPADANSSWSIPGQVWGPGFAPWDGPNTCWATETRSACWEHGTHQWWPLGVCHYAGWLGGFIYVDDSSYDTYPYCDGWQWSQTSALPCTCSTCLLDTISTGPRIKGCFAPETRLTLADGSTRRIDQLAEGAWLWDPLRRRPARVVKIVRGPEAKPLIEIGADGQVIKVSSKHPMITAAGLKAADELQPGDAILTEDGAFHPIDVLDRLPVAADQQVWNVELDQGDGEVAGVIAGGVVTGDLKMQHDLDDAIDREREQGGSP